MGPLERALSEANQSVEAQVARFLQGYVEDSDRRVAERVAEYLGRIPKAAIQYAEPRAKALSRLEQLITEGDNDTALAAIRLLGEFEQRGGA